MPFLIKPLTPTLFPFASWSTETANHTITALINHIIFVTVQSQARKSCGFPRFGVSAKEICKNIAIHASIMSIFYANCPGSEQLQKITIYEDPDDAPSEFDIQNPLQTKDENEHEDEQTK